jgi:hypothetical protein
MQGCQALIVVVVVGIKLLTPNFTKIKSAGLEVLQMVRETKWRN